VIVAGAVLAGGASRRMGRPKAFIDIDGIPMVVGVANALRAGGVADVVVAGGDGEALARSGLEHVPDRFPGAGPLGGIITALRHHEDRADVVVVLSCDLVAPSPDAVRALVGAAGEGDVVVPTVDGWPQWTHALWRTDAVETLSCVFAAGVRAPRQAVRDLEVVPIAGGDSAWYVDADTPDQLPGGRG